MGPWPSLRRWIRPPSPGSGRSGSGPVPATRSRPTRRTGRTWRVRYRHVASAIPGRRRYLEAARCDALNRPPLTPNTDTAIPGRRPDQPWVWGSGTDLPPGWTSRQSPVPRLRHRVLRRFPPAPSSTPEPGCRTGGERDVLPSLTPPGEPSVSLAEHEPSGHSLELHHVFASEQRYGPFGQVHLGVPPDFPVVAFSGRTGDGPCGRGRRRSRHRRFPRCLRAGRRDEPTRWIRSKSARRRPAKRRSPCRALRSSP